MKIILINALILQFKMKVLSLNLWFSDYLRKERTLIFINYVLENQPDIICIQEVIAPVLAYIYQTIKDVYPHIHTSVEEFGYGLAIISKLPIENRQNLQFNETKMNRGILYGKINNCIVATTHLESEFKKVNKFKIQQFNKMTELLTKYDKVIIIGDTNLTKYDEDNIDIKDFKDVYLTFDNSKEKLYTYDGKENPILKNKIRSRVDRMFIKGEKSFKSFELEKNIIMSDHYALVSEVFL